MQGRRVGRGVGDLVVDPVGPGVGVLVGDGVGPGRGVRNPFPFPPLSTRLACTA